MDRKPNMYCQPHSIPHQILMTRNPRYNLKHTYSLTIF